jgi:hypothetical protein
VFRRRGRRLRRGLGSRRDAARIPRCRRARRRRLQRPQPRAADQRRTAGPAAPSPRRHQQPDFRLAARYVWMRTATLDFCASERARATQSVELGLDRADGDIDMIAPADATAERVASDFAFTEDPCTAQRRAPAPAPARTRSTAGTRRRAYRYSNRRSATPASISAASHCCRVIRRISGCRAVRISAFVRSPRAHRSTRHQLARRRCHRCSDTPVASAESTDADSWFVRAGGGVTLTRLPCVHR